jgi:hypothetical protein
MIKVDLDSLLKFLAEKKYDAKLQNETKQIYVILSLEGREFPLFIRIFDSSDLLQLLVFMPCQIKHGVHADLARLLHLINKELDLPGFGMDENAAVTFYRCMLPIPNKKIDENLLETHLKSITLICESISPPVIAVASGLATFEEILKKANESLREK